MAERCTIEYEPEWRRPNWDSDVPSRPAWFVTCPQHPHVGRDNDGERWGYASSGIASSVAARHMRSRYHRSTS